MPANDERLREIIREELAAHRPDLGTLPMQKVASWLETNAEQRATDALIAHSIGAAEIGTLPTASLMHTGGYSTGNNVWTTFLLSVKEWDTDRMLDVTGNPGKIYCKTRGFYLLTAQVFWATDSDGAYRLIGIDKNRLNTGPLWALQNLMDVGSGANAIARGSIATILPLNVGDYAVFNYYQDSGGALATYSEAQTDEGYLRFSAHWLGDYASDKLV